MAEEVSTAAELHKLGLTPQVDESVAKKIKGELLIIEGRLSQGNYHETVESPFGRHKSVSARKLYGAAYHAVAAQIVNPTTPSEVLVEVIPAFLLNFSQLRDWHPRPYDLQWMRRFVQGPITEWEGKRLVMPVDKLDRKKPISSSSLEFPKRAACLRARLKERNWGQSDITRHSGPDRKTIRKILAGEVVREDVLDRLARALSAKYHQVDITDIPSE